MIGDGGKGMVAALASGDAGARRRAVAAGVLAASALALPGCAALDVTPPWAPVGARVVDMDSLTVRRVTGGGAAEVPVPPLTPEPGDIWPLQEAPRVTLADPADALRDIPPYRPEGMRAEPPPPAEQRPPPPARRPARRGSSSAPPPPPEPRAELRLPAQPPALPVTPPPARVEGRVIPYPGGQAVTTGGTEQYQTFGEPGTAGGGVAVPEGPTTVLIGPDGRVRVVPTPR
ncbi:hypothetical protein GCM10010964_39090 [Caldovatus sediminis]|uniref:Uncharacterized protein n=1 Tax=Caldovatus sediminis TaxID=2041189 RepID=A0A8J2ZET9_9PROT|nr:hypothetical protein [Caldovatus sediminis]GGG47886.1 hypothetical protein GCM10010964_39090 [Caldovatus sediminis]